MRHEVIGAFLVIAAILTVAGITGHIAARAVRPEHAATIQNLNERIRAWWVMVIIVGCSMMAGWGATILLFVFVSLMALREFLSLVKTNREDHRALIYTFFVVMPCHYYFVYRGWYGLYSIFIPVWAFLLVPISIVLRGGADGFLERVSEIQWALIICVYFISYAPALAGLPLRNRVGSPDALLLYLMIVSQASDVLQYIFGHLFGKHPMAPKISPHKTWEGFYGGVAGATILGAALYELTPFRPLASAGIALIICLTGVAGGLTMSAIKRDRGIKDFGTSIPGHGGILDRIDSLCFSAPVLFHLSRFFYG